jgi:hypothetical protein
LVQVPPQPSSAPLHLPLQPGVQQLPDLHIPEALPELQAFVDAACLLRHVPSSQ